MITSSSISVHWVGLEVAITDPLVYGTAVEQGLVSVDVFFYEQLHAAACQSDPIIVLFDRIHP